MPITFTDEPITDHVVRIKDGTDVCMYLIVGSAAALLVDTGYGLGDLRGHVESLLDGKPYRVVCTHGHVDHASGAAQFDEVLMNSTDLELFGRSCTVQNRIAFLEGGKRVSIDFKEEDFLPQRTAPFGELGDGEVFDLGDLRIRTVHVPGHTQGMTVLIDEEERIAFFGDACGEFTLLIFPEASTVTDYRTSLERLREHEGAWDRVLRQHGSCESPKSILTGNIDLCSLVIARDDDHVPMDFMGQGAFLAKAIDPARQVRLDGGIGNLVYLPERI